MIANLLAKIDLKNDYNYITIEKSHLVIEKHGEKEFEISYAPAWKLQDLKTIDYIEAEDEQTFYEKLERLISKKLSK